MNKGVSSLKKLYGHYSDLVGRYVMPASHIVQDVSDFLKLELLETHMS